MEDIEGEKLRLVQRKEFLETRIMENKAWAANYGMQTDALAEWRAVRDSGPCVPRCKRILTRVW